MSYVITNDVGEFYAGFQDGRPIWFKSKRAETRFDSDVADMIVKQLGQLGFTGITKQNFQQQRSKP